MKEICPERPGLSLVFNYISSKLDQKIQTISIETAYIQSQIQECKDRLAELLAFQEKHLDYLSKLCPLETMEPLYFYIDSIYKEISYWECNLTGDGNFFIHTKLENLDYKRDIRSYAIDSWDTKYPHHIRITYKEVAEEFSLSPKIAKSLVDELVTRDLIKKERVMGGYAYTIEGTSHV